MTEELVQFVRNVKLVRLVLRVMRNCEAVIPHERVPGSVKGYRYPLAEEYLGKDAEAELEKLAGAGLLEKEVADKELACPHCGSIVLALRFHCPNCDSIDIEKDEILEHFPCGFNGPKAKYVNNVCPKCGQPLGELGVDYARQGQSFVCINCGEIFQAPAQKLYCPRDKISFNITDAVEKRMINYHLTPRLKDEINKAVDQQRYIEEKINALGFKTESPALVPGRSGVNHEFFLTATTGFGFVQTVVVVDVLSDHEISTEQVLSLYAKAVDIGAYGLLLAAIPRLSEDAQKVAESYGIICVEAEDLTSAAERLVDKFGELVQAPEERAMQIFGGLGGRRSSAA